MTVVAVVSSFVFDWEVASVKHPRTSFSLLKATLWLQLFLATLVEVEISAA